MFRNVYSKWLWDNRRSIAVWAASIAAVGIGYAAFWPTIDSPAMQEALAAYPEGMLEALNYDNITTPAGYLISTVYGLLAAILLVVYGAGSGARMLAGDEEDGTLDLILAHPVARVSLGLQRFLGFVTAVALINLVLWAGLWAISGPARLTGISLGGYAAMHLQLTLFGTFFGAVAFAVGAATGRRMYAIGAASGVAVMGFFANGVIASVDGLEWMSDYSPFEWMTGGDPLTNGVQAGGTLLLLGFSVLLVTLGLWAFTRRDLGV